MGSFVLSLLGMYINSKLMRKTVNSTNKKKLDDHGNPTEKSPLIAHMFSIPNTPDFEDTPPLPQFNPELGQFPKQHKSTTEEASMVEDVAAINVYSLVVLLCLSMLYSVGMIVTMWDVRSTATIFYGLDLALALFGLSALYVNSQGLMRIYMTLMYPTKVLGILLLPITYATMVDVTFMDSLAAWLPEEYASTLAEYGPLVVSSPFYCISVGLLLVGNAVSTLWFMTRWLAVLQARYIFSRPSNSNVLSVVLLIIATLLGYDEEGDTDTGWLGITNISHAILLVFDALAMLLNAWLQEEEAHDAKKQFPTEYPIVDNNVEKRSLFGGNKPKHAISKVDNGYPLEV